MWKKKKSLTSLVVRWSEKSLGILYDEDDDKTSDTYEFIYTVQLGRHGDVRRWRRKNKNAINIKTKSK